MPVDLSDYLMTRAMEQVTSTLKEKGTVTLVGDERGIVHGSDPGGVDRLMVETDHSWANNVEVLVIQEELAVAYCEVYPVLVQGQEAFMTVVLNDDDDLDARLWQTEEGSSNFAHGIKSALQAKYPDSQWRTAGIPGDIPPDFRF